MVTRHRLGVVAVGVALGLAATACQATNPTANPPAASPSTTSTPSTDPTPPASGPTPGQKVVCPKGTPKRGGKGQPVTLADLCSATLPIPSWGQADEGCPHGRVTLTGAEFHGNESGSLALESFVLADVDHDEIGDAVVLIACQVGDPPIFQAAAFARRQDSLGGVRSLGVVIGPINGDINAVYSVAANPNGSVQADVSPPHGSSGEAYWSTVLQTRTYTWTGGAFVQSAGSTSFEVDRSAVKLAVSMTKLTVGKPKDTVRPATLTVTVRNTGTSTVNDVWVRPVLDGMLTVRTGSGRHCKEARFDAASCTVGDIAAGESKKVTIEMTTAADAPEYLVENATNNPTMNEVQVRVGDQRYDSYHVTLKV
jgi:hypothetical protein